MARNTRRKKAGTSLRFGHDLVLLLVGVAAGAIGAVLYQGATSGDPDRLGAGISELLRESRDSARDSASPASSSAKTAAPARTSFDFYTVLPEIEHVIPETGAFESAPASAQAEAAPDKPKSKANPAVSICCRRGHTVIRARLSG